MDKTNLKNAHMSLFGVGVIYKQSYNYHTEGIPINKCKKIKLRLEEIVKGFVKIACDDCDATGEFVMPDGTFDKCVCCKGQGFVYMNTL